MIRKIKKVAIVTEFIYNIGGIEKSILQLINGLNERGILFDIYCGLYDQERTFPEFKKYKINTFLNKKLPAAIHSLYLRSKFNNLKLSNYDGYIIYGAHSIASGSNNKPNVFWSMNPLGYLYLDDGAGINNSLLKMVSKVYLNILRYIDKKNIIGIDYIYGLGPLSKKNLEKAYPEKEIGLLPQPVDLSKYKKCNQGEYYLSIARLTKSVDKVINAFIQMPDKKLVVVGSGTEEEKSKIKNLAMGYDNIKILGFVAEEDIPKIYSKAIAVIAINKNEDTPMNIIEGLASGKPSISINPDESTKHEILFTQSGVLMKYPTEQNIMMAVKELNQKTSNTMKKECMLAAKQFSNDHYVETIINKLEELKK